MVSAPYGKDHKNICMLHQSNIWHSDQFLTSSSWSIISAIIMNMWVYMAGLETDEASKTQLWTGLQRLQTPKLPCFTADKIQVMPR